MEMKKYKLGDIADINKQTLSKKDSMEIIEYLDTGNLTENIFGPMQILSRQDAPSRAQRRVFDKTILYSTVRPRLKHYGFLESPKENTIVSTGFATIDVKDEFKNVIDARYLYLLLIQDKVTEYLGTIADTAVSAYPSLNPSDIQALEFEFPDMPIQKKVASFLCNIDKRIENLRAQNRVLEQTAKTIYDYTFLQCAGRKTVYNKTLKRNIPTNWEVKKLSDVADILSGGTPKTARQDFWDGDIPWLSVKDFNIESTYVLNSERKITKLGLDNCSATLLEEDDIVMSARGTVGVMTMVPYAMTFNQSCFGFHAKDISGNSPYFLYYTLKTAVNELVAGSHGSVFNTISRDDLGRVNVAFPDSQSLNKFNAQVKPIFQKQLVNTKQIETLTTQRNTLLPLLMTGQVVVG